MLMQPTTLRLGIWEKCIGVYFNTHHLPLLEERGVGVEGGKGLAASYDPFLRCLRLEVVDEGGTSLGLGSEPDLWPYRTINYIKLPTARCEIGSMTFDVHREAFTCILPPDHELAWPRLRRHCDLYDREEVARREITLRLASQREHGVPVTLAGIPKEYQLAISAQERVKIAQEAGYAQAQTAQAS